MCVKTKDSGQRKKEDQTLQNKKPLKDEIKQKDSDKKTANKENKQQNQDNTQNEDDSLNKKKTIEKQFNLIQIQQDPQYTDIEINLNNNIKFMFDNKKKQFIQDSQQLTETQREQLEQNKHNALAIDQIEKDLIQKCELSQKQILQNQIKTEIILKEIIQLEEQ